MVVSLVILGVFLVLIAFDVIRFQHEGWLIIITFDIERLCLPVRKVIQIFHHDKNQNRAAANSRHGMPAYVPTPKRGPDSGRTKQG
jgi:hypothetical protein